MTHKYICTVLLSLLYSVGLMAQHKGEEKHQMPSKEQIRLEKKQFLTKELQLTAKESQDLMLILNELDEQRFSLWKGMGGMRGRLRRGDKITEEEYSQHFDKVMNNRVREAELERTYYTKCKGVIPMHKLIKLDRANREFAKQFFMKKKD